ncbi:MAG: PfkB family carbohydrate kinase [Hyphomicrobiales bacterium]
MSDKSCLVEPAIVVIGSLHYDILLDAPVRPRKGETVVGHSWHPKFGGKGGNQALAAVKAGIETRFVGGVGVDDFSTFMLRNLEEAGISTKRVSRAATQGTGMSVAIMDAEGDYGAIIVSGANASIDLAMFEDEALWTASKILILQNEIPASINVAAAHAASKAGLQVCLNAAPTRELSSELLELVDVLVVNAIEAEDLCGLEVTDLATAQEAASTLNDMVKTVVVTAGGDGVAVASSNVKFMIEALPVELISTHGAGDMFVGTLCAELARGDTIQNAAVIANKAAADHVSKKDIHSQFAPLV